MQEKVLLANSVSLKLANADDLPAIFLLVDDYAGEIDIDRTKAKNSLRDMVYIKGVLLVEFEGRVIGGVAGYTLDGLFNDDIVFSVMFFYIMKEFRFLSRKTITELEFSLMPLKINKLVFGVPFNDDSEKYKRFYKTMGYSEMETHVQKRI